jgi:hypothetical protein
MDSEASDEMLAMLEAALPADYRPSEDGEFDETVMADEVTEEQ